VAAPARGDETVGGGGLRSATRTDIRRNQQKVERRYGSFVSPGTRPRCATLNEAEMMLQDQFLFPTDLRDMERNVEAAAVDLGADIPPWLDHDAVES
jgi:hypothetical protein